MREKNGNRLVPGLDYMVDALKISNQAPRASNESQQTFVVWRCPDGTQHLFFWPILDVSDQSLASNCPDVDSRNLNLAFGHTEANRNEQCHSSPTKYTLVASWPLVLVWASPRFDHDRFRTILSYVTHFSSQVTIC
ncbi:hypothetical protein TNCV_253741 [Trichonephila clavipes]|nr:hypothetical protein TNCV_253741 [Trichonephila clavipes]